MRREGPISESSAVIRDGILVRAVKCGLHTCQREDFAVPSFVDVNRIKVGARWRPRGFASAARIGHVGKDRPSLPIGRQVRDRSRERGLHESRNLLRLRARARCAGRHAVARKDDANMRIVHRFGRIKYGLRDARYRHSDVITVARRASKNVVAAY